MIINVATGVAQAPFNLEGILYITAEAYHATKTYNYM